MSSRLDFQKAMYQDDHSINETNCSAISTQFITPQKQSMLGQISQSKTLQAPNDSIDQQSNLSTCSRLSFRHDPSTGLYRKRQGQLVLTHDQMQKLESIYESNPCFLTAESFGASLNESQDGSTGERFWASMVQQLYVDVFEQFTLTRETIL